jgi:phage major head subunit gpT-like protein
MLITDASLRSLFTGYSTAFREGMQGARSYWRTIAMEVPSTSRENEYGWLGAMPGIREWVGERVVHNMKLHGYALPNKTFEATVAVKRTDIEDDQYGTLVPAFKKMGADAERHPDNLVFNLLKAGFTTACYDRQFFFDTDHPVGGAGDLPVASVSNSGGGSGAAWYLLDCSQPIKPLIYQNRAPYELTRLDRAEDENVFFKDEYVYGVRARANAGFGLWQLAYASKQVLDETNYSAARAAMMGFTADNGQPLNVTPTHLVVPTSLEAAGRAVLAAATKADGASNIWAGTAELIVTPWVN